MATTSASKKKASSSASSSAGGKKSSTPGGPSSKRPPAAARSSGGTSNTAAGEHLLDRLRILLNRLQSSAEILQNWPEARGDSARVHADTAAELVASIRKVVLGLRGVERHVNGTGPPPDSNKDSQVMSKEALEAFRTSLESKCPIPLDLLDLLDVGQPFGMNPQCYARGLMKESMRQLAGRRHRHYLVNRPLLGQFKSENFPSCCMLFLLTPGVPPRQSHPSTINIFVAS